MRSKARYVAVAVGLVVLSGCKRETVLNGQVFVTVNEGSSVKLGGVDVLAIAEEDLSSALGSLRDKEVRELARLRADVESAKKRLEEASKDAAQKEAFIESVFDRSRKAGNAGHYERANEILNEHPGAARAADVAKAEKEDRQSVLDLATRREEAFPSADFYFLALPRAIVSTATNADGAFSLTVPIRKRFAVAAHATRKLGKNTEHHYWLVWVDPEHAPTPLLLTNKNLMTSRAAESVIAAKASVLP